MSELTEARVREIAREEAEGVLAKLAARSEAQREQFRAALEKAGAFSPDRQREQERRSRRG